MFMHDCVLVFPAKHTELSTFQSTVLVMSTVLLTIDYVVTSIMSALDTSSKIYVIVQYSLTNNIWPL